MKASPDGLPWKAPREVLLRMQGRFKLKDMDAPNMRYLAGEQR
jgi:hypothetical protein